VQLSPRPAQLPASFTPPGLTFDEPTHRYELDGRDLISVTRAIDAASLIDHAFFTDDARALGTRVHAAIALGAFDGDDETAPYLNAYRAFLAETAYEVVAREERLGDASLGVAGTCDLRGRFPDAYPDMVDLVDLKTGEIPPWVGYQTAGYVRLFPPVVRVRTRRWVVQLRGDGGYRLRPLVNPNDASVFLAAVTIARAKAGRL
jgi:hypothetical protein